MRSSARWLTPALCALLATTGCDIEFLSVDPAPPPPPGPVPAIRVAVQAQQEEALRAVALVAVDPPLEVRTVVVQDVVAERVDPRTESRAVYGAEVAVDTLSPRLTVTMDLLNESDRVLHVPLLARTGAAEWLDSEELLLPVRAGDAPATGGVVILMVRLEDGSGQQLVGIEYRDVPLPERLVLPAVLVPAAARVARVVLVASRQWEEKGLMLQWSATTRVTLQLAPAP